MVLHHCDLAEELGREGQNENSARKKAVARGENDNCGCNVIGIPLVEFFWWMRFVHLGVPYYEADSYEELDETCSDAPYHMILPAENTIPFENGTYFVNLNGNQRNASLAGYSIHSEVHVLFDLSWTWTLTCSGQTETEYWSGSQTEYREVPIQWDAQREDAESGTPYQLCSALVSLGEYRYRIEVRVYGTDRDQQEFLEYLCRPAAESLIDQWYEAGKSSRL